jgi:hypothetical protein
MTQVACRESKHGIKEANLFVRQRQHITAIGIVPIIGLLGNLMRADNVIVCISLSQKNPNDK